MDQTVPAPAGILLDLIGRIEAGSKYNCLYGHNENKLPVPLTEMRTADVLNSQKDWSRRFGSSACGRYQFIRATLMGLAKELSLEADQIFDPDLQDRLGFHLLRRRGFDAWLAGNKTDDSFMLGLAQEWASFPVPVDTQGQKRWVLAGQSYYAGDGLNHALVSIAQVKKSLNLARQAAKAPIEVVPPPKDEQLPAAALEFTAEETAAIMAALTPILQKKLEEMQAAEPAA